MEEYCIKYNVRYILWQTVYTKRKYHPRSILENIIRIMSIALWLLGNLPSVLVPLYIHDPKNMSRPHYFLLIMDETLGNLSCVPRLMITLYRGSSAPFSKHNRVLHTHAFKIPSASNYTTPQHFAPGSKRFQTFCFALNLFKIDSRDSLWEFHSLL